MNLNQAEKKYEIKLTIVNFNYNLHQKRTYISSNADPIQGAL